MSDGKLRIKRLERLWTDDRPLCSHAFTLIVDGKMIQDDAACTCGGERMILIAASETSAPARQDSTGGRSELKARLV
ncbi:MAG TPA: hypothetical protein VNA19_15000 [Pyrinomonadaceae bacterium]|jgi:hypothetical protein|nr:hypothetical protein [Pyrinomonadaceae bacterium]